MRLGREKLEEMLAPALATKADGVLATVTRSSGGLTRFAGSRIHQNTHREDIDVRVMAIADSNRCGVASANGAGAEPAARAAADALAIARVTPADPQFPGLAPQTEIDWSDGYHEATDRTTPEVRASLVAAALAELSSDAEGAGAVETTLDEVLIVSSTGIRAYAAATRASISVMAMTPDSSGYAEMIERRLGDLDAAALAARAARKAELGRHPREIEPGAYTVVLEPAATSTILQFLGYLGFGAKAFLEERSFMAGRLGQKIMSDRITISDDPLGSLGLPFDFEGTPSQKVSLVEKGVAHDVVWDRTTAARAGRSSTGHGLPPPNPDGPYALNLRMEPSTTPLDDLIAGVERGLLVTRFHYSNVVSEKEAVLTGMTRDGTFLIEGGKLAHGVRNLRYTQNALEALSNVEDVGDRAEISSELFFGGARAPALRIHDFKFSSTTDH